MHPPLTKHKHPGCYDLIVALEECHAQGFLSRFSGSCNATKKELSMCLREERLSSQRANQVKARDRNRKAEAVWKDIDAES